MPDFNVETQDLFILIYHYLLLVWFLHLFLFHFLITLESLPETIPQ